MSLRGCATRSFRSGDSRRNMQMQVQDPQPPRLQRTPVLGGTVMPAGTTASAAAAGEAARRRFRVAGYAVLGSLPMGKRSGARVAPDRELQEMLQNVDAQLHEVVTFRSTAAGQKRAERSLRGRAGCDGDVAACLALLSSRAFSTSHRHEEVVRMIRRFSYDASGSEPDKPPPLGKVYDDSVAECWDIVLLRGVRTLLRACLCTQHSREMRERRLQRIYAWFVERSRGSRLAGDIMARGMPTPSKETASSRVPEQQHEVQVRPRVESAHGVIWLCGNNMGIGSPYTPRNSPATHSMGRMPSSARMTLER